MDLHVQFDHEKADIGLMENVHIMNDLKCIEIIGEAANHLTKAFLLHHKEVEWSDVIGMRHVLAHDHYNISPTLAWKTATTNIPILKRQIDDILQNGSSMK